MDKLKYFVLGILAFLAFIGLIFFGLVALEVASEDEEINNSQNITQNSESESQSSSGEIKHDLRPTDEPIKVYIEDLDMNVEGRYGSVPRQSMSLWEKSSEFTFEEVNSKERADIYFRWVKNFGDKLGHAVQRDFVEVGLGNSRCNGDWKPYKYNTVTFVSSHELGHALGYKHINESDSLMRPTIKTSYKYDLDREELIPGGYSKYYSTCTQRNTSTYEIDVRADQEFSVYMLESREEFDKLLNRETFSRYEECLKEETTNVELECTVESEAVLAIQNNNEEPLKIDVRMEETTPIHSLN